jgi:signal transduction histidine kinase
MQNQGFANFKITPGGSRDVYTALLYTQPNRQSSVTGLDLYTEPSRKLIFDRARDGGAASLTEPLKSVQGTTNQLVFSMFVPQYRTGMPTTTVEQRRAALEGFMYAGFRSEDFFNKLLPANFADQGVGIRVSTGNSNSMTFYESSNYGQIVHGRPVLYSSQTLEPYGQHWLIDYAFSANALTNNRRRDTPVWTVVVGSLFAILLAEVVYLLLKARAQDLTRQRDRAVDIAKDELLSLASHQLRTPATTVKQYLGMVLQGFTGDVTKQQRSLLEKAYDGNERQLFIINEMLHVAKIDAGRITLAKQRTNINRLLESVTNDVRGDALEAGHTIRLKLPKKAVWLSIDEHMLRMSIENLINNAIKYSLKKTPIDVGLTHKKHDIVIAVKDKGIGIDKKDFHKLYKLFSRLNNKRTQMVSGTGVGLYLAKHLVELHDGCIKLQSAPGKGSTFSIVLPNKSSNKP